MNSLCKSIIRCLLISMLVFLGGIHCALAHGDHLDAPINAALPPSRDQLHVIVRLFTVAPQLPYTPREAAILGRVVADLTANTLTSTNVVHVLDEAIIEKALNAQNADWVQLLDAPTMAKIATTIDVDLIVSGTITALGLDAEGKTVVTELGFTVYEAKAGKVLCTGTAVGINAEIMLAVGDTVDPTGVLWSCSRMGRATRVASEHVAGMLLAALPITGQVLTVLPDGSSILDAGYTLGIRVNDKFTYNRVIQMLNAKGELIKETVRPLGTLTVIDVLPNACICAPVDVGADVPQSDDVVTLSRK